MSFASIAQSLEEQLFLWRAPGLIYGPAIFSKPLSRSVYALAEGIFAQSDCGAITGTNSDSGGAIVAGAQIEPRNFRPV